MPRVSVPKSADDKPTLDWRRNRAAAPVVPLPPAAPVSAAKCPSRLKWAFRPPPRSSEPRKPQMLGEMPPLAMLVEEPPAGLWFCVSRPRSTLPYSTTALWAAAAPESRARTARASRFLFIKMSPVI